MIPITVPVPPQFEAAVSWTGGESRWLSVCWSPCGDCPWLDDGRSSMTGTPWGLLAWLRHPAVAAAIRDLDIGSSERDGRQRLLLDREYRRMFVCGADEARVVVREQWPHEEPVELSVEQWKAVVERVRRMTLDRPLPTMHELMRQMREHAAVVADMVRWLDRVEGDRRG